MLFAGLTVIIALLGMLAIGLSFISGLGIGAAAVVAVTVVGRASRLLPAVLGFVGTNIDKWRLPWVHDDGDGTPRDDLAPVEPVRAAPRVGRDHRRARDRRCSSPCPVLSLRLGFDDAGNDPSGSQTREAYDLLSRGFGPGFNGPFLLAIQLPPGGESRRTVDQLHTAVAATPGVASVSPAITQS